MNTHPSAAPQHLPWKGRKILHITKSHFLPEFPPPPRGSARRARGFYRIIKTLKGSARRPRGFQVMQNLRS